MNYISTCWLTLLLFTKQRAFHATFNLEDLTFMFFHGYEDKQADCDTWGSLVLIYFYCSVFSRSFRVASSKATRQKIMVIGIYKWSNRKRSNAMYVKDFKLDKIMERYLLDSELLI